LASNGSIALVFVVPLDEAGNVIGERKTKHHRGETIVFRVLEMRAEEHELTRNLWRRRAVAQAE
jgi:hypothetical protein